VTVSVAGTANVVNVAATGVLITGNANISVDANIGGNIIVTSNANIGGTANITGNANVGNVGTGTVIATTANLTTINSGLLQNGTSNVSVTGSGNISLYVNGNATARAVFTSTGANVAGTANISGNANVGNIGTGAVVATANISTTAQYVKTTSSGISGGASGNITRYPSLTLTSNADIHLSSTGTGNTTVSKNYGITFSQGSVGTTGAILFSENTTDGTGIGFYVSNNYSAASPLKLSIEPSGSILPGANAAQSLGSTTLRWSNVWGVSSSSLYADLAEKYRSDADYVPGTVLELSGEHEITVCNTPRSDRVFGCVSTDPAYLMNDNSKEGIWLPVVLVGRAPIRVAGPVSKGDRLVSAGNGAAMAAGAAGSSYQTEIGRALETKTTADVGLIQAYVNTK
jgi:hypothetical protein